QFPIVVNRGIPKQRDFYVQIDFAFLSKFPIGSNIFQSVGREETKEDAAKPNFDGFGFTTMTEGLLGRRVSSNGSLQSSTKFPTHLVRKSTAKILPPGSREK
ncbi:hypothetical protein LINPERHAP1_LOCUS32488, partial [Linum perenne]